MRSKYNTSKDRRAVLPGYPVEFKFTDLDKLKQYFAGDTIVCLRCGKKYRTLSVHLKTIHGMEPDEYRDMYGIPWTYGLSCEETYVLHAEYASQNHADGIFKPFADAAAAKAARSVRRRKRQPVCDGYCMLNIQKMNEGKTGEEQRRRNNAPRKGTLEYQKKMRNRPQCKSPPDRFKYWWSGKKQTDEHVRKRTRRHNHGNQHST